MSDRELLVLAAKAAGIGPLDFDYAEREGHGFYFGPRLPMPEGVLMAAMWAYWNPRDNDGDALRLLARLPSLWSLKLMFGQPHIEMAVACGCNGVVVNQSAHRDRDRAEAIRHAIFDAAVEIGRRMP